MAGRTTRTKIKSNLKAFSISDFGGLNNEDNSTMIEDNQAQDLLNVQFAKEVFKRGGYTEVNSTAITGSTGIYGLYPYYMADGTAKLIYASHTVLGWIHTGTGATTNITTGLTSNQRTRAVTFNDLFISVNGSDNPQKIDDATGADLGGSPPVSDCIAVHKDYLFLAGSDTYPSRLYYSGLDTPETWGANDFTDVYKDDGDKIIGLKATLDSLIIFKEYNVYILYGDTPTYTEGLTLWRIKKASTDTGCVGAGSVANIGKNLVYLSRNKGIQTFGGGVTSQEVEFDSLTSVTLSRDITPTIEGLNSSRFSQAESINWDYKYILSLPNGSSTTNNYNLVYDYSAGGWTLWNIPANCWAIFKSSGVDHLYFGSTTTGKIYRYTPTTYSDNGTAITAYYKTKDFNLGSSVNDKIFRKFYVTLNKATDYTLTTQPQVDFGEVDIDEYSIGSVASDSVFGTAVFGTDKFGAATTSVSDPNVMNARGKFINYKFTNDTLNENIRLRDVTQYFRAIGSAR